MTHLKRPRGIPPTAAAAPAGPALQAQRLWRDGIEQSRQGRHAAAVALFEQAVRLHPEDALYHLNLARSLHALARPEAALASARQAWTLAPHDPLATQLLAELLRLQQRHQEALQVLAGSGTRGTLWHLLEGAAQLALERPEAAAQAFLAAIAAEDCSADWRIEALMQLGHCLARLRLHAQAADCYRTVTALQPQAVDAAINAAHHSAWACTWPELQDDLARLQTSLAGLDQPEAAPAGREPSPFGLLSFSDDPALLRRVAELACRPLRPAEPPPAPPLQRHDGRLRLGLLSSDFHHHATAMLLVQALEAIDPSRFELHFYSGGPDDGSALQQRIRACARRVRPIHQLSDAEVAAQIRADGIAILFDLKGHTHGARLGILAQRPAPLQVAWLGYPGSSGADFIDYIIGDPVVTPLAAQADYSERIAQLPHCYQPNDSERPQPAPLDRAACGLPEQALVLASFNQSYKMGPELFGAWCHILAELPGSLLWLLVPEAETQARLRTAASACGIDPARLVFAPFLPTEQHRARLPCADLILDTYPCSGHTTSSDALWAGVPVLTLCGHSFGARVAASLLATLGLPELICNDIEQYAAQAIALGRQPAELQALRQRLAEARQTTPTFDGRRFAADLQALLLRMVERADAGLPPAPLPAAGATA